MSGSVYFRHNDYNRPLIPNSPTTLCSTWFRREFMKASVTVSGSPSVLSWRVEYSLYLPWYPTSTWCSFELGQSHRFFRRDSSTTISPWPVCFRPLPPLPHKVHLRQEKWTSSGSHILWGILQTILTPCCTLPSHNSLQSFVRKEWRSNLLNETTSREWYVLQCEENTSLLKDTGSYNFCDSWDRLNVFGEEEQIVRCTIPSLAYQD